MLFAAPPARPAARRWGTNTTPSASRVRAPLWGAVLPFHSIYLQRSQTVPAVAGFRIHAYGPGTYPRSSAHAFGWLRGPRTATGGSSGAGSGQRMDVPACARQAAKRHRAAAQNQASCLAHLVLQSPPAARSRAHLGGQQESRSKQPAAAPPPSAFVLAAACSSTHLVRVEQRRRSGTPECERGRRKSEHAPPSCAAGPF